jgi:hypothetical protein
MMHLHLLKSLAVEIGLFHLQEFTKSQLHFLMTTEAATSHVMLQQPKQLMDGPESLGDRRATCVP